MHLAVAAARQAGIQPAGDGLESRAIWVAQNADARSLRNDVWEEYEAMLADERTWSLRKIVAQAKAAWDAKLTKSSVDRDRKRYRRRQRVNEMANAKIRSALQLVKDLGQEDLYRDGTQYIQRLIMTTLLNYAPEALEELKPAHVVNMMDTFTRTGRALAATQLDRLAADQRRKDIERFDQEVAARMKAGDGRLSAEQIGEIRKHVFGEVAA